MKTNRKVHWIDPRQTRVEKALWSRLRNHQTKGFKFRRKAPIYPYVVDFDCPSVRLVVKLDGEYNLKQSRYDSTQIGYLEKLGYRIIRFQYDEVLTNIDGVIASVARAVGRQMGTCGEPHKIA